ncbi:MAG TPA: peptidylprolyl isomerase [Pirellulales bacterium]|jgi:peptidyl-prolyl cis-trans isomerase C|nr:peptidylprolyl isomerase [Pirellulales bacterium]
MRSANTWRLVALAAFAGSAIVISRPTSGADPALGKAAAKSRNSADSAKEPLKVAILATVDDKPIFSLEVDRALAALTASAPAAEKGSAAVRAAVLNQLIDRRLVQAAVEQARLAATPDEVDLEITRLKSELARSMQTLDQFLLKTGQTESMLRAELAWQLTWQRYLQKHATDEALESFFKTHHREFDGTELRVSHVLFRPMIAGNEAAVAALIKQAEEVRRQILAGEIKFADAAEKYSAGPSRHQGGDLGFVARHGVMVEPFNRAAFALEKGEISPPVATVFGIHLITVTDEKPGDKKLADVRDIVRSALTEQLFEQLAARQRPKAKIEMTGSGPYFKPGTTELVVPGKK